MGASLPSHLIKQRIRRHLQKLAAEYGGAYAKFEAFGTTNGLEWRAGMGVVRASNGESFGLDHVEVSGPAGVRHYPLDLPAALDAYRVESDDTAPGEPGSYARLFQRQTFFQSWGRRYCIGLDIAGTGWTPGFTLFDCETQRALTIQGDEADALAPTLFRAVRPHVREPEFKSGESLAALASVWSWKAARADNLDSFVEAFASDPRWIASDDWRAKPGHGYGSPGKKPFGLATLPDVGAGVW